MLHLLANCWEAPNRSGHRVLNALMTKPTGAWLLQSQLRSGVHEVGDVSFPRSCCQNLKWHKLRCWKLNSERKQTSKSVKLTGRTSTPVSVTTMVCSNWAESFPSWVTEVQLSGHVWSPHTCLKLQALIFWDIEGTHPLRDHWLDGEAVTRLHHTHSLVLCIVRHIGCAVEQPVYM